MDTPIAKTAASTAADRTKKTANLDYAALLADSAAWNQAHPMDYAISAAMSLYGIQAAAELVTEQGTPRDQMRVLHIIRIALQQETRQLTMKRAIQYLSRNAKDQEVKTLALVCYIFY